MANNADSDLGNIGFLEIVVFDASSCSVSLSISGILSTPGAESEDSLSPAGCEHGAGESSDAV